MDCGEVLDNRRSWGVLIGDAADTLRTLPDGCVQCCVTSPPYYGLRSYLPKGHPDKAKEIGLEETPEAYIGRLVGVFREVRRVLRDDGLLWVNIGDSYTSGNRKGHGVVASKKQLTNNHSDAAERPKMPPYLKAKDRIGIPHMLAFALRADGWYFRDEVVWAKVSPMPASVRDRTTAAHEFVFMFSKSARYYYDIEAIKEPSVTGDRRRPYTSPGAKQLDGRAEWKSGQPRDGDDFSTRQKRSVWRVAAQGYKGSHYATYPPKLIEPCVLAGTSARGCCPACGAPWVRVVERRRRATRPGADTKATGDPMTDGNRDPRRHVTSTQTVGWRATCWCPPADPVPCLVLDPFVGSGTTLAVGLFHGRRAVGCDLDGRNLPLIERRVAEAGTVLLDRRRKPRPAKPAPPPPADVGRQLTFDDLADEPAAP